MTAGGKANFDKKTAARIAIDNKLDADAKITAKYADMDTAAQDLYDQTLLETKKAQVVSNKAFWENRQKEVIKVDYHQMTTADKLTWNSAQSVDKKEDHDEDDTYRLEDDTSRITANYWLGMDTAQRGVFESGEKK